MCAEYKPSYRYFDADAMEYRVGQTDHAVECKDGKVYVCRAVMQQNAPMVDLDSKLNYSRDVVQILADYAMGVGCLSDNELLHGDASGANLVQLLHLTVAYDLQWLGEYARRLLIARMVAESRFGQLAPYIRTCFEECYYEELMAEYARSLKATAHNAKCLRATQALLIAAALYIITLVVSKYM